MSRAPQSSESTARGGASSRRLSLEEMAQRLRDFIAGEEGVAPERVEVRDLHRLAGGASRMLWSLDVCLPALGGSPESTRTLELVLRQDPPGRIQEGGMALEFALLEAAAAEGVPVPAVYWCQPDPALLSAPFFAMQRVRGESIPRRLLRDDRYAPARAALIDQLGRTLASIHRIDPDAPSLAGALQRPTEGRSAALFEVDKLALAARSLAVEPHPVLDLAERWLRANLPRGRPLGLVHGDYRVGNFMFDENGLLAVLDWELAHVGDPVEDLAWLCVRAWRFGNDHLDAGGLGSRAELVTAYEKAGGAPVDLDVLRFWEVLGNFKLALVFITQARAYLDGAHTTVELASLGRRTAEAEDDLLRLVGEAEQ